MKSTTMRAVGVVPDKREVRLIDQPIPEITSATAVKVRCLETGICGTDREICTFVYGAPPDGQDHLVLGHESLGEVVEVGADVTRVRPGDLVVPSVRRPCSHAHCAGCRSDKQDFCYTGDFTERGIKMTHGFLTEYYVDDQKYLATVPAELRDVGVLVEPLTIAEKAMAQVWQTQRRLPWISADLPPDRRGQGKRAVVLGAGPVGLLGAMVLVSAGFETYVYSRSPAPNVKAGVAEAIGARYISSVHTPVDALAAAIGNIDLVYEAIGVSHLSYEVLRVLGMNGIFVFTGIPAPGPATPVEADAIMRNLVLKNQAVVGTVNADRPAFEAAISDLGVFRKRWADPLRAMITGRHVMDNYRELLLGKAGGIKNVVTLT